MKKKEEFCIMPQNEHYSTKRTIYYCERHEICFGTGNRQNSINDGLVVFLTAEGHRGVNGVHGKNGQAFNEYLKRIGQQAWQDYYRKTTEDFIHRYGKNYL